MYANLWQIDGTKILLKHELAAVLADLKSKSQRTALARGNRAIFRLASCCGLRVSEIAGLTMGDVVLAGPRPYLKIRAQNAKGGRGRRVPLWWDAGTLDDLRAWHAERGREGARPGDPFICGQQGTFRGRAIARHAVRRRFLTACKPLGLARVRTLTIHHGRHTFISHALAGGRTLAEVKAAAGHSSLATTSAYLHVAVEDGGEVGELFG
jgi:integrase